MNGRREGEEEGMDARLDAGIVSQVDLRVCVDVIFLAIKL